MNAQTEKILKTLTTEEKASLCSGKDFWHTKSIEEKGVPGILMTDGPHGLRRLDSDTADIGIGGSAPATCFPTACLTACSFDRDLLRQMGEALGNECREQGVQVVLGPGVNMKRSPVCGRNFEYFSEDPFLAGELAASVIDGVESKGIGTSLKHFAANSQEKARFVNNSVIDERALREIYLSGFERAVKKGNPRTLMCSYNKINGVYSSENKYLLTDILRDEWGFKGAVMSDWGAVNDRVKGVAAGLDLEMPFSGPSNDKRVVDAVKTGVLSGEDLDKTARRMVDLVLDCPVNQTKSGSVYRENHVLAGRIVRESAVLLKNEGALPASTASKAAVIGAFVKEPRYQGSGSSRIHPTELPLPYDAFLNLGVNFEYAPGYSAADGDTNDSMIQDAVAAAAGKDIVFIFAGLPDKYESEGFDRSNMDLPESHNRLITEIAKTNPNTVVILFGGAPVLMPWIDHVKSVLLCYLPGQAGADAIPDLLYGKCVPCGKLAETFPLAFTDNPSYGNYGDVRQCEYRESIYIGYRYYDKAKKSVLFPFGHGLSYSAFVYSELTLDKYSMKGHDSVDVSVRIENSGRYDAAEVVQFYVESPESRIFKAEKELKGFSKVFLRAGEAKVVTVTLDDRAFSYYNTNIKGWHLESGTYRILAAASSRDIRLAADLVIESDQTAEVPDFRSAAPAYYSPGAYGTDIPREQFEAVYGAPIKPPVVPYKGIFDLNSTVSEVRVTLIGRILKSKIDKEMTKAFENADGENEALMMKAMINDLPLRSIALFSDGKVGIDMIEALLLAINGHLIKGIKKMITGRS